MKTTNYGKNSAVSEALCGRKRRLEWLRFLEKRSSNTHDQLKEIRRQIKLNLPFENDQDKP